MGVLPFSCPIGQGLLILLSSCEKLERYTHYPFGHLWPIGSEQLEFSSCKVISPVMSSSKYSERLLLKAVFFQKHGLLGSILGGTLVQTFFMAW